MSTLNDDTTKITTAKPNVLNPLNWALHWQILAGILIGVLFGIMLGAGVENEKQLQNQISYQALDFIGGMFIQGLKMLIVPLIAAAIISAMARIGSMGGFARIGLKTLLYYVCTSGIAIIIGLGLVNLIEPGSGEALREAVQSSTENSSDQANLAKLQQRTAGRDHGDILLTVKQMLPQNVLAAASNNSNLLGVIVFSLLFGFYICKLKDEQLTLQQRFWDGANNVMIGMTNFILAFAAIGIACLIAETTADSIASGQISERFAQLGKFTACVLLALGLHMFVVMPLLLAFVGKVNPIRHFKAMWPAIMTAFSTASSAATLPLTLECVQKRAGVSKEKSSFVLPLGATVNMDGTALYECVVVLFACQLQGIDLGFGMQLFVVIMALLTSIGVAGIPSASLVAIVIILQAVSAQLPGVDIGWEQIAFIMLVDRLLDMCRTAVNIFGDSCGAVIIAKSEGESPLSSANLS